MAEINNRIAKVREEIIETKIMREKLGLKDYDEIIDDFEVFITTIESQQTKIESLMKMLDGNSETMRMQISEIEQKDTLISKLKGGYL